MRDVDWCRTQLLDLVAARDAADDDQRSRLLSALFESIDAEALPQRVLRLVAAPRDAWRGYFQSLVLEREKGLEPSTFCLGSKCSTNCATPARGRYGVYRDGGGRPGFRATAR
jgi:hypothetical protein